MKYVISLDIGGTNMRAAVSDEHFNIVKVQRRTNDSYGRLDEFYREIIDLIYSLDFPLSQIENISLGIPGRVRENGKIDELINVGLKDIDLVETLSNEFHKPIFVRNDAEMALLAETFLGKGKDFDGVYFITVSTGVGGAFAYQKRVKNYGREIGHMPILYKGKYYDFESICSGKGLINLSRLNNLEIKTTKELFELVETKNTQAIEIIDEWITLFTQFLQFIHRVYQPDIYTFTGGVFKSKQYFFEKLKKANPELNLQECHFQEDAGLIGGACLGFSMIER